MVIDVVHEVDDSKAEWDTVVVKVRETLKGGHKQFHTFAIRNGRSTDPKELSRWTTSSTGLRGPVLLFPLRRLSVRHSIQAQGRTIFEKAIAELQARIGRPTAEIASLQTAPKPVPEPRERGDTTLGGTIVKLIQVKEQTTGFILMLHRRKASSFPS